MCFQCARWLKIFFPNRGWWNFMCYQDARWWCLLCYQGARLESTGAVPNQMHPCWTCIDAECDLWRDCMWVRAFLFGGPIVMKMKPTIVMKIIYLFCAFVHIYRIINHFSLCLCLHSTYYYRSFSFVPLFMWHWSYNLTHVYQPAWPKPYVGLYIVEYGVL